MLDRSVKSLYRITFFQNLIGFMMTCGACLILSFLLRPSSGEQTSTFIDSWINYGILGFLFLIGYIFFKRLVGKNLKQAKIEEELIDKMAHYSAYSTLRTAILGGLAITVFLFSIISRSEILYYLALAFIVSMIYFFPTKARICKELELSDELKQEFAERLKK